MPPNRPLRVKVTHRGASPSFFQTALKQTPKQIFFSLYLLLTLNTTKHIALLLGVIILVQSFHKRRKQIKFINTRQPVQLLSAVRMS